MGGRAVGRVTLVGGRRFIGRHLTIRGEYAERLLEGGKVSTIRLGVLVPRYRDVIIHGKGRPLAKARIVGVEYKKVSQLTDYDARRDGFRDLGELVSSLRRIYGRISGDDTVTIIKLDVVKRLDSVEPRDPYMGLEPADLARLSLRYIGGMFSGEELRILKDLTETNSIRATAARLHGSPYKRSRVRGVLRKASRLLVREGILGRNPPESLPGGPRK